MDVEAHIGAEPKPLTHCSELHFVHHNLLTILIMSYVGRELIMTRTFDLVLGFGALNYLQGNL